MSTTDAPVGDSKIWYDANCHCRAIKLRFKSSRLEDDSNSTAKGETSVEIEETANCNCSICAKNGYLLVYPDYKTEFEWIEGEEKLSKYNFGSGMATHLFCPTCGSTMGILADFAKIGMPDKGLKVCVNVRMVKGIDVDKLKLKKVDGWSRGEQYQA